MIWLPLSSFPAILHPSSFPAILHPSSFPAILHPSSFPAILHPSSLASVDFAFGAACFAIGIFLIGLGLGAVSDSVTRVTLTCPCGHQQARDVLILDDVDRRNVIAAMTEHCAVCRSNNVGSAVRAKGPVHAFSDRP